MDDDRELIVCRNCDALYRAADPGPGHRAVCARCHTVLIAPRRDAGVQVIALSLAALVLITGAAFLPFLRISVAGFSNSATVVGTAFAFSGPLLVLSAAVAAMIVGLPLLRLVLTLYVLVPLVAGRPLARGARRAFRLVEELRPWSMAEIFAIGCAVALVKVADLARIGFGPAFWMFLALVVILVVQERFICRWSLWKSLETSNT
ncbi:MAG: paraquat-inducible protein A [Tranquillimonas sp.]|jgi:paraquat-inducible protein A